jgi:hypothetical protein
MRSGSPLRDGGNAVKVFLSGRPYLTNDAAGDPRLIRRIVDLFDARTSLTVPLTVEDQAIGVCHAINKRGGPLELRLKGDLLRDLSSGEDRDDRDVSRMLADFGYTIAGPWRFPQVHASWRRPASHLSVRCRDEAQVPQARLYPAVTTPNMALRWSRRSGLTSRPTTTPTRSRGTLCPYQHPRLPSADHPPPARRRSRPR